MAVYDMAHALANHFSSCSQTKIKHYLSAMTRLHPQPKAELSYCSPKSTSKHNPSIFTHLQSETKIWLFFSGTPSL